MICVVINGPTYEEAHQQILQALEYASLIELRLDCFTKIDLDRIKELRSCFLIPMIFTLRSQAQGGNDARREEDRVADMWSLLSLEPEYLDVEYPLSACLIEKISSTFPNIKLILSFHHFKETPDNLEQLYQEMKKTKAHFYKIALMATNCLDALRLICFAKQSDRQLIAISMGSHGQLSRILAPWIQSPITYAALEENDRSATGQLAAKTLIDDYHHNCLNPHSKLYGLIGDPVNPSISDKTHNALFKSMGLDAVYVKIQVLPRELSDFLKFAKQLPFQGLSVTMPLKEVIIPLLDGIDPEAKKIGAVNTLLFKEDKIYGFNTDGIGAVNVLEEKLQVKDKKIVIIGAGGSAKAIAYEAHKRGAFITLMNRDEQKAQEIALHLQCIGKKIDEMSDCFEEGYDILINCTPVAIPISSNYLIAKSIVMDIVTRPKDTLFLKLAMKKDCHIIYGYQMFIEQALGQFLLWFKNGIDIKTSRSLLHEEAIACLEAGSSTM